MIENLPCDFYLISYREKLGNHNKQTTQANECIKDEKMPQYSYNFKNPKIVLLGVIDILPSSGYNVNMTLLLATGRVTNSSRIPSVSISFSAS